MKRRLGQSYAFVATGVTFLALLATAALRATPGLMMVPLQRTMGWSPAVVSAGAACGLLFYGLTGPFAGAMMQALGIRRTMISAFAIMATATALSSFMTQPWEYVLTWGIVTGVASGAVAAVLGATMINRWFVTHRGLMVGLLSGSTATGALVFLPAMAHLLDQHGWRTLVLVVAGGIALLAPLTWLLLPERPQDIGLRPYGASADYQAPAPMRGNPIGHAIAVLLHASKRRTFWLLFVGFFICGFTTNGLIGTHLVAFCGDHGMGEAAAAGLLATMGLFDLVGTTASGWLTDRYDPRKLLFVYYSLRGLSLIYLPFCDFSPVSLAAFAVFYGLDWIATVPPTVRLANETFGERDAPIVYGWIAAGHQAGAASATLFAGFLRTIEGRYLEAFVFAGGTAFLAALASIVIRRIAVAPSQATPVIAS